MERELIINWVVAVDNVKKDVFQTDLEGGEEKDQDLFAGPGSSRMEMLKGFITKLRKSSKMEMLNIFLKVSNL